MTKSYGIAVKAVVSDKNGRVLLLRRSMQSKHWPGQWEPPGGKPDAGEDWGTALIRETREETGLEIELGRVAGACDCELPHIHLAVLFIEARAMSCEVRLSEEHDAYQWVSRDELSSIQISEQVQGFLMEYVRRNR